MHGVIFYCSTVACSASMTLLICLFLNKVDSILLLFFNI